MASKQVTLDEIATATGASRMTVARVLSATAAPPKYGSAKRRAEAIRKAAAEMGYQPNAAARAVASGRFNAIGLVSRMDLDWFPSTLLSGVARAASARGLHVHLSLVGADPVEVAAKPSTFRELCVDGLLLHYARDIPNSTIAAARRQGIPTVWMNAKAPTDCVYPDEFAAAVWATKQLIAAGHRRIAYVRRADGAAAEPAAVAGQPGHYSGFERLAGYTGAMADAGLTADVRRVACRADVWTHDPAFAGLSDARSVLAGPGRPTAVLCGDREEARLVTVAALAEGLRLPEDVSVIGFADSPVHVGVGVPTMVIPLERCAAAAVEMLEGKIANPGVPAPGRAVAFDPHLAGGAIAPPADTTGLAQ